MPQCAVLVYACETCKLHAENFGFLEVCLIIDVRVVSLGLSGVYPWALFEWWIQYWVPVLRALYQVVSSLVDFVCWVTCGVDPTHLPFLIFYSSDRVEEATRRSVDNVIAWNEKMYSRYLTSSLFVSTIGISRLAIDSEGYGSEPCTVVIVLPVSVESEWLEKYVCIVRLCSMC